MQLVLETFEHYCESLHTHTHTAAEWLNASSILTRLRLRGGNGNVLANAACKRSFIRVSSYDFMAKKVWGRLSEI